MPTGDRPAPLTPARWRRVKGILADVLELPSAARADALETACAGDDALRREVESFMVATTRPGEDGFLETPIVGAPPGPDPAWLARSPGGSDTPPEIRLMDLAPYTRLRIRTRSSEYRLVVVAPMERAVVVEGGRRFTQPTRARLLDPGVVAVGRVLPLQLETRKVVTTRVRSIEVVDGDW